MKFKFLFILFIAFTANISNAQVSTKVQMKQIKDRYELQKQTIQNNYKTDMESLKAQTNITHEQRKAQERQIKDRYEQQKRTNRATYKNEKRILQTQNKIVKRDIKETKKDMKDKPGMKPHPKPIKPPKPIKH